MNGRFVDRTGQRFGRLTAMKVVGRTKSKACLWLCQCSCGTKKRVASTQLVRGAVKSCGCLMAPGECARRATKHGMVASGMYGIWHGIKQRCYNRKHTAYRYYGARGIRLFEPWHDIAMFVKDLRAELGPRPSRHELDRIDNDGDYAPGNIRWVTHRQNHTNRGRQTQFAVSDRGSNKIIRAHGLARTVAEWSVLHGVPARVIRNRIRNLGWKPRLAVVEPVRTRHG